MKKPTVFISYNDDAHYYLITLKNTFNKGSHESRAVIIDWRESGSTNLKKFMESAGERDFVVLLISDGYLKSENCMYEIADLIKRDNWKEKKVPTVLSNSNAAVFDGIIDSEHYNKKINCYVKYWENKRPNPVSPDDKKEIAANTIAKFLGEVNNMVYCNRDNGIAEIVKRVYENCLEQQAEIYRKRSAPVPYESAFEESDTIRAMGMACRHLCTEAPELEKYLTAGKKIQLIIWDPTCCEALQRAIDEHGDEAELTYNAICNSFRTISQATKDFVKNNSGKAVNLELRLQTSQPTTTCTITDNYVFFNHYGKEALGLGLPCYRFYKQGAAEEYEVYENQFQSYWESADMDDCFDFNKEEDRKRWEERFKEIEAARADLDENLKLAKAIRPNIKAAIKADKEEAVVAAENSCSSLDAKA